MGLNHPLDRAIWSALTSRQSAIALDGKGARRFAYDISPLAAPADLRPASLAALSDLIPIGEDISMLEPIAPDVPGNIEVTLTAPCLQMIAPSMTAGGAAPTIEALSDVDAEDMLALATLTRPGPFKLRTHTLGRFLGVRENRKLIAMAGERLNVDGFHEISAVCTHPDFRGRGLAGALMRAVGARILSEGDTPFLHTYANNATAIALYESLGFKPRATIMHCVWKRPQ